METKYEFAELICGREDVPAQDGRVVPMFTIRLHVFPQRGPELLPVQALPKVYMAQEQFPHLLQALQAAMERYFPGTQTPPSAPGSGGTTLQ
jgi:hypothetical protein